MLPVQCHFGRRLCLLVGALPKVLSALALGRECEDARSLELLGLRVFAEARVEGLDRVRVRRHARDREVRHGGRGET